MNESISIFFLNYENLPKVEGLVPKNWNPLWWSFIVLFWKKTKKLWGQPLTVNFTFEKYKYFSNICITWLSKKYWAGFKSYVQLVPSILLASFKQNYNWFFGNYQLRAYPIVHWFFWNKWISSGGCGWTEREVFSESGFPVVVSWSSSLAWSWCPRFERSLTAREHRAHRRAARSTFGKWLRYLTKVKVKLKTQIIRVLWTHCPESTELTDGQHARPPAIHKIPHISCIIFVIVILKAVWSGSEQKWLM